MNLTKHILNRISANELSHFIVLFLKIINPRKFVIRNT